MLLPPRDHSSIFPVHKNWPADKIIRVPVEALIPYARNARTHSDEQVAQIAASMREWGWTNPILIDEAMGIIAGHGRVLAARKLGLVDVPAMVAEGWSEAQKRAYVLADNQLALNAGWDADLLKLELGELQALDFDLGLIGFPNLDALLADKTEGLTDPDDVPEPPADPVTRLGDVWLLGRHRLMCGDSTSVPAMAALMAGEHADLLFTSPPYAQQRDYGVAKEYVSDWDALMQGVFAAAPVKDDAQLLVNLGLVHKNNEWQPYWERWIEWMREQGWRRFGWYVWDQGAGLPGDWNGRLAPSHEFVFHFNKETRRANKFLDKKPESVKDKTGDSGLRGKNGKINALTNGKASLQPTKIADSVIRVNRHAALFLAGSTQRCSALPSLSSSRTAIRKRATWYSSRSVAPAPRLSQQRRRAAVASRPRLIRTIATWPCAGGNCLRARTLCWKPLARHSTPSPRRVASMPRLKLVSNHRLVCGDCTDPLVVDKALNGVRPHLMVTDPPYGVEYDANWRNGVKRADGSIVQARAVGKVLNDDNADWREAWALFPGDVAYVWHAGLFAGVVGDSLAACDFAIRNQIIWDKGQLVMSRGDYHWQHEPCWYAVKKGAKGHWAGDRKQTTIWNIPKPKRNETGHSTQKPVECMKRPIENNSSPGQAVYEPFSGSGTTIIAGEMTGRRIHAIELNPAYVDVAVKRWEDFTGEKAVLENGG